MNALSRWRVALVVVSVIAMGCPRPAPSDEDDGNSGFTESTPDSGSRMTVRSDGGAMHRDAGSVTAPDAGSRPDASEEGADGGGSDGGAVVMDGGLELPDAATNSPDAAMDAPDAAMDAPDAAVIVPDAGEVDAGPCPGAFFVDGVCCTTRCNGVCESCAVPGSEGTCTPIGNGEDPDNECPDMAPETCGTVGTCNGQRACTLHTALCDDGNTCTHSDQCSGGMCRGQPVSCPSDACVTRSCNGTQRCTELVNTGASCSDGNLCSYGETCDATGACTSGTALDCDVMDQQCLDYRCDGTPMCMAAPRNLGMSCDDGNPMTGADQCQADGVCRGVVGCALPVDACVTGTQSRDRCQNSRIIGRATAASTSKFTIASSTCNASNRFDDCDWDAGRDHAYRLWMRSGETASIKLVTSPNGCNGDWDATLKIFESTGCADVTCGTDLWCRDFVGTGVQTYVADQDGWVVIVVDGSTAFDDWGDYTLTVGLSCRVPGCEC